MDAAAVAALIRWAHLLAASFLLAGPIGLIELSSERSASQADPDGRALLAAARRYEFLFWIGVGLIVMTGVGNLGSLVHKLESPAPGWSRTLALKLLAVLFLLPFSLVRSVVVARIAAAPGEPTHAERAVVRRAYLVTFLLVVLLVGLGVFLAHG